MTVEKLEKIMQLICTKYVTIIHTDRTYLIVIKRDIVLKHILLIINYHMVF